MQENNQPLETDLILPNANSVSIAAQNDNFRQSLNGSLGKVVMTCGVSRLLPTQVSILMDSVRNFDNFDPEEENDPHCEHDFGMVELFDERFFWKIDCYDKSLEWGSPDASDPSQTTRVLTVMKASEY